MSGWIHADKGTKMRPKACSKKKVSQEYGPVIYENLFLHNKLLVKTGYLEKNIFFSEF